MEEEGLAAISGICLQFSLMIRWGLVYVCVLSVYTYETNIHVKYKLGFSVYLQQFWRFICIPMFRKSEPYKRGNETDDRACIFSHNESRSPPLSTTLVACIYTTNIHNHTAFHHASLVLITYVTRSKAKILSCLSLCPST